MKSAQELNESLRNVFEEDEIYRIDHYLGKPMVQNLEALEFANPVLQAIWNNQYIANVQITASETVGVEERAGYYDQAGAIRDMFQNHMLQLLMMTAMKMPERISSKDIRNEKIKVMEYLRPLLKEDVAKHVVRGQYGPGKSMVNRLLDTEKNQESMLLQRPILLWLPDYGLMFLLSGVPFYIRTGKRMREKCTKIVIEFKNPLKDLYITDNMKTVPNLLVIEINPNERVSFQLNSKNPIDGKIEPVHVNFSASQKDAPEAYEILLYDALRGDSTYFAHWKEVELSWKWVQPILEAFEENILPLHHYTSGSMGPEASHKLLEEDGFNWW